MRRVWLALLLLLTAVVVAGMVYVIAHNDPVPDAGQTLSQSGSSSPTTLTTPETSSSQPSSGTKSETGSSDSPATLPPHLSFAFLGDDWTLGLGPDQPDDWTKQVGDQLSSGAQVQTIGQDGAGYSKQSDGKDFEALVGKIKGTPDVIVVSGGRNDRSDDPSTFKSKVKTLFRKLKTKFPHARVFALTPFFGDSTHPEDLKQLERTIKAVAKAAGADYVDVRDPLYNHSDWMADAADPNTKGYDALTKAVVKALGEALASSSSSSSPPADSGAASPSGS